jgi:hypothetical protein
VRQLAYVLVLLQAAMGALAGLGEVVVMGGNPIYLLVPAIRAALLVIVAVQLARRWAAITLIVLEGVSLIGFWLSVLAGMTPWVDYPVNLVGLLTNVVLPGVVLYLAVWVLANRRSAVVPAS